MKTYEFDRLCGSIREAGEIRGRGTGARVIRGSRTLPDSGISRIRTHAKRRDVLRGITILAGLQAFSFAADSPQIEKLLGRSPDRRFGTILLGERCEDRVQYFDIVIRDLTTYQTLWLPDEKAFGGLISVHSSALWSPDSSMVIVKASTNHDQGHNLVLRLRDEGFDELKLPEGAVPVRWSTDNQLVVTLPVPTVFNFDSATTSFVEAGPLKSDSR